MASPHAVYRVADLFRIHNPPARSDLIIVTAP